MGRPIKKGLDFFPLDVTLDDNIELLEAECGLEGFAILIKLWQKIYSNSYYIEWQEDNALLFARKVNSELNTVNSVINVCFKRNIFDKTIFNKHKILTSKAIQKRYLKICADAKRKDFEIESDLNLINPELTSINSEFSTQSKVEERKEDNKKNVSSISDKQEQQEEIKQIRSLYPGTKTKAVAIKKLPEILKKYSLEELKRCIDRYIKYVDNERKNGFKDLKYLNESTFWNGRYLDFTDEEYKEEKKNNKKSKLDVVYSEAETYEQAQLRYKEPIQ